MSSGEKNYRGLQGIFEIVKWILSIITILILIGCLLFLEASKEDSVTFFGYRTLLVLSDSMRETDFKAGDLILIRRIDPKTIEKGDIICYERITDDQKTERITHKVRSVTADQNGQRAFITYGTTTGADDPRLVYPEQIEGIYCLTIPLIGRIASSVNTVDGYLFFVLIPFSILILFEVLEMVFKIRKILRTSWQEKNPTQKERSHHETSTLSDS